MSWTPDICIYHSPCQDGFTAAWAIWKRWPQCEFVPAAYGEPAPDMTGKRVLIVDFSYKREVLMDLAGQADSIVVLDHHKSAMADLAPYVANDFYMLGQHASDDCNIWAKFDMDKSGARLAWDFAFPGYTPLQLILHVEDRDLWRFALLGTREIAAVLFSHEYDFDIWDLLAAEVSRPGGHQGMISAGAAIERKHHKDVRELIGITRRWMVIGDQKVPVANLPYTMASDAANLLAREAPFGVCYFDDKDGKRRFSLRSTEGGADVSLIASRYGGGGHAHAAGFTAPIGWEGE